MKEAGDWIMLALTCGWGGMLLLAKAFSGSIAKNDTARIAGDTRLQESIDALKTALSEHRVENAQTLSDLARRADIEALRSSVEEVRRHLGRRAL
jgi:hypothetical protein